MYCTADAVDKRLSSQKKDMFADDSGSEDDTTTTLKVNRKYAKQYERTKAVQEMRKRTFTLEPQCVVFVVVWVSFCKLKQNMVIQRNPIHILERRIQMEFSQGYTHQLSFSLEPNIQTHSI